MSKDVRGKIIDATIRLIEERGSDVSGITVRDICNAAGVNTALVNYHFQSKDNLIAQCVQAIIGNVIERFRPVHDAIGELPPLEKLRVMMKGTGAFLAANENISRISILTDLTHAAANDNTAQTAAAYFPLVRQACPTGIDDDEAKRRTYLIILTLQAAFLRTTLLKEEIGADFLDQRQRDRLIDAVIDLHLGCGRL